MICRVFASPNDGIARFVPDGVVNLAYRARIEGRGQMNDVRLVSLSYSGSGFHQITPFNNQTRNVAS
jgi:hypothetical protein